MQVAEKRRAFVHSNDDTPPVYRWYVVRTQPRKERLAQQQLERQGFSTFLPFAPLTTTTRRNKAVAVKQPLFSGYLFVQMDVARQRWRAVNSTVGVLYLVQFGDRPSPMPVGATEVLLQQTDEGGFFSFDAGLSPGDQVRIVGGPMNDFIGELQRKDGAGRSLVLLELMNRKVSVIVPDGGLIGAE